MNLLASMLGDDDAPELMPTPRHELARLGGTARLCRFERPEGAPAGPALPLLVVPSMINRWYVVDLRPGASLVEGLVTAGIDTFCLDWGVPEDEDRYLAWDEIIARIGRAVRRVKRETGASRVGILGYCMGATVSAIYTALEPESVAAFVNLAGPIDFSQAGVLGEVVDPRWFDAAAVASAGNVHPVQMQAGFVALRPTLELAKWVRNLDQRGDRASRVAARALETWSSDNIPFPGRAYLTYITELYQENRLLAGTHRVGGRRVDLGRIRCPVLTIVATRDSICPSAAACALGPATGSSDASVLEVPGGHVGAVVGSRAARDMYPATAAWLRRTLDQRELAVV